MSTPPAVTFVSADEEIAQLRKERDDLELMVQVLESRVDWFAKAFYGPKTERRPPVQDHGPAKQESFLEFRGGRGHGSRSLGCRAGHQRRCQSSGQGCTQCGEGQRS